MHIINASVHKMQTRTRSDSTRSSKLSSLHMVGEYGNHAQPAQESLPPDSHARQAQMRYGRMDSEWSGRPRTLRLWIIIMIDLGDKLDCCNGCQLTTC